MEIQEALKIVSYKLGAKNGEPALNDSILIKENVEEAIADKANNALRKIDLKSYMLATKVVKQYRLDLAKQKGEAFLADNATAAGVKTKASGLQYKVLEPGSGNSPQLSDKVTVHYHGTLIDGTVFDSSVERGTPASFTVSKVIEGWKEGLQLMSAGSKYQFFIPQNLAYGDRGTETTVPPFATLTFEVELLAID
ncbi:MAG: FKBP-type peptidyl-prolyl cis-trans isomerase [Rubritalea sp.]|uniref:FKBP-type peptidyl-prolyl cis-trans isomerase n=1 Tax=Rubritalea sp. TaxID=2109375 RepID=UPI0032421327